MDVDSFIFTVHAVNVYSIFKHSVLNWTHSYVVVEAFRDKHPRGYMSYVYKTFWNWLVNDSVIDSTKKSTRSMANEILCDTIDKNFEIWSASQTVSYWSSPETSSKCWRSCSKVINSYWYFSRMQKIKLNNRFHQWGQFFTNGKSTVAMVWTQYQWALLVRVTTERLLAILSGNFRKAALYQRKTTISSKSHPTQWKQHLRARVVIYGTLSYWDYHSPNLRPLDFHLEKSILWTYFGSL